VVGTLPIAEGPPQQIAVTPDGQRAFVSVHDAGAGVNAVVVLDVASGTVVDAIPTGRGPFPAAVSADGERVYVPVSLGGHLDVLDGRTGALLDEIDTTPNPRTVVLDADGRLAYTADPVASVVSVLDVATGDVAATVPVGSGPHALAASPDGTRSRWSAGTARTSP
jgi:serine/threonine-protein kinase